MSDLSHPPPVVVTEPPRGPGVSRRPATIHGKATVAGVVSPCLWDATTGLLWLPSWLPAPAVGAKVTTPAGQRTVKAVTAQPGSLPWIVEV